VGSGTTQVRRCRKDDDAVGSGRTMVSWAQERRRVHSVAGSRAAPSLRRTAVRCSTVTHDAQRCSALMCTTTSYSIPDTRHQVVSRPSSYRREQWQTVCIGKGCSALADGVATVLIFLSTSLLSLSPRPRWLFGTSVMAAA
jgi:hypothetical protein